MKTDLGQIQGQGLVLNANEQEIQYSIGRAPNIQSRQRKQHQVVITSMQLI
ncbi:hypothetical protein [Vibrio jasicida]|uniref:hypothetical protein n=1 Tax=Vibrio jasicida TaxID=766224 RepID=UPI0015E2C979|nr:hypothetical protein [Vibrio jasicida]